MATAKAHATSIPESLAAARKNGAERDDFAKSLLVFEASVRAIEKKELLLTHIVNETRHFLGYRQAFLLMQPSRGAKQKVVSASSVAVIDRNTPAIQWIEGLVERLSEDRALESQSSFVLPAYSDSSCTETKTYPFQNFLWTPLLDGGQVVGGLLAARELLWATPDEKLAERFATLYLRELQALKGRSKLSRFPFLTRKKSLIGAAILAGLAAFPVRISAVAPAQIVPSEPSIVSAPFAGVISEIVVAQGARVEAGEPLVRFDATERRNAYEVAIEAEAVAQARFLRASQSAITDDSERREVAIAKAELVLAEAEKTYALQLLEQSELRAEESGIAVYTDRRDFEGKPVQAGQQILQIANPELVKFSIDLPVKDSLVLEEGSRVKVFPDSSPLKPYHATVEEISYEPRLDQRNILSYRISARLDGSTREPPRIGIQGTAKLEGDHAPLIFAVLRRPISMIRQWTGI